MEPGWLPWPLPAPRRRPSGATVSNDREWHIALSFLVHCTVISGQMKSRERYTIVIMQQILPSGDSVSASFPGHCRQMSPRWRPRGVSGNRRGRYQRGSVDYAQLAELHGEAPEAQERHSPARCIGARFRQEARLVRYLECTGLARIAGDTPHRQPRDNESVDCPSKDFLQVSGDVDTRLGLNPLCPRCSREGIDG